MQRGTLPRPISDFQAIDLEDPKFAQLILEALQAHFGLAKLPRINNAEMQAEIVAAIGSALGGGAPISAAAAVHLLERLRARKPETSDAPALTGRETELLQIFAKGYSYKEAARIMVISPLTVGNHDRSIYRKLDVHTRGEAVYEAMRSGKLAME